MCDDRRVIRRLLGFAYAVLLRTLMAVAGAITFYGATAMFTSAGVEPPNIIVIIGGVGVLAAAIVTWLRERRLDGLWPAILIITVPFALIAFGSWTSAECPPDHPPITQSYSCAVVGSHAIAIVAPFIALAGLVLFVRDIRALAKR